MNKDKTPAQEKPATAEIVTFDSAKEDHVHARKEAKLKKVQQGFKSVTKSLEKASRQEKRRRNKSNRKKKK